MSVLDTPLAQALGWTLVHFIWQGALVAAVLGVVLVALRRHSAQARYLACCAGMAVMMLAPVVTLIVVAVAPRPPVGETAAAALALLETEGVPLWQRLTPYLPALTLFWILGVALTQARFGFHFWRAQRLKRSGTSPAPLAWEQVVRDLGDRLGIARPVRIVESSLARVPTLIGYLEPVILVPASAWLGLTGNQLRVVIAHELGHVRRHDYLVNLIQAVFESLLFYHPAVWWLSGRLRVEREYCCDDIAVAIGGDRLCYAQALASLEDLRSVEIQPALASTGGALMNRIRRLIGVPVVSIRPSGGWVAPAALTLAVLATASAVTFAWSPQEEREREREGDYERRVYMERMLLERVDLVAILEEFSAERAEIIRMLRETGMSNEQLVGVLEVLGTEGRVFEAVHREVRRQNFIGRLMQGAREKIHAQVEEGLINEEEAHRLLQYAEIESVARYDYRLREGEIAEPLENRLVEVRAEVEAAITQGHITPEQGEKMIHKARRNIINEMEQTAQNRAREFAQESFVKAELNRIHEQIVEDVELGRISEDDVHGRFAVAREEFLRWWEDRSTLLSRPYGEKVKEQLAGARRELEHAVAAGKMTEAEAGRKLEAIAKKLEAHREADGQRVLAQRRAPGPAEIVWASLAPALAKAAEAGDLAKDQIKAIHAEIVRDLDRRLSKKDVHPGGEDAIVREILERVAASLMERGVPRAEALKAIEIAQRNLKRHQVHTEWEQEQKARQEREREQEHEQEHEGEPDG